MKKFLLSAAIAVIMIISTGIVWAAGSLETVKYNDAAYSCKMGICSGYTSCLNRCTNNCIQNQSDQIWDSGIKAAPVSYGNVSDTSQIRTEQKPGIADTSADCIYSDDDRLNCKNNCSLKCNGTNYVDEDNDGLCDNKEVGACCMQRRQQAGNR